MIQIISGEKGKGKTKHLLERVNVAITETNGNVVYLDKNTKHMYELDKKIRLISVPTYPITNCDEFLGFVCGILSQDNDIQEVYLDSFLTIAFLDKSEAISQAINKLRMISEQFNVKFVLSVSRNEADLPAQVKPFVVVSL